MKLNETSKKQLNEWIDVLYKNEYPQATGQLQSANGYCCLGVACDLLIPKDKQIKLLGSERLMGGIPDLQKHAPSWLKKINMDFAFLTGKTLIELNDVGIFKENLKEFTFPEIAMMLDLVYNYNAYGKS